MKDNIVMVSPYRDGTVPFHQLVKNIEAEITKRRDDAGYSGSWGDNGAGELRTQLNFWRMGLQQKIPNEWNEFVTELQRQSDPDYQAYLILKKKFEND